MSAHLIWWLIALALGIIELLTGTFWLLVAAAGAVAAAVASHLGLGLPAQLGIGAAVLLVGSIVLHRFRPLTADRPEASRNRDINLDIGERIEVRQWAADRTARVPYRGSSWEVELLAGEPTEAGQYVVREVIGNRLLLAAWTPGRQQETS